MTSESPGGASLKKERRSFSIDMTQGSPYRLIFKFSVPLLIGNVLQQLYNTVDSIVVGQSEGTMALAAVGAGFPIMFAFMSMFLGIGQGGTILVSQSFGAKDFERLNRTVSTVYRILMLSSIAISVVGFFIAGPLLQLLNVPNDGTLSLATLYLQIIFLGMIGNMGFNVNAGLLQGLGDGVTSLIFLGIATLMNIALDLLFVLVFHWGVAGVAIATVLAQTTSWLLGILYINRNYDFISIHLSKLAYDRQIARDVLRLGIPNGIQMMMFSVGAMVLSGLINSFGKEYIAGINAANKIDAFVFMPTQSFAIAVSTYVGQNYGAKNLARVRQGLKSGLILTVGASVVTSLALIPLGHYVLGLFSSDAEVIRSGMEYLRVVLPFYFVLAILFTYNSMLRGLGQTLIPTIATIFSLWIARVPSAYLLTRFFGREWLFLSYGIGWILGCMVSAGYYHFGKWHERVERALRLG